MDNAPDDQPISAGAIDRAPSFVEFNKAPAAPAAPDAVVPVDVECRATQRGWDGTEMIEVGQTFTVRLYPGQRIPEWAERLDAEV